MDIQDMKEQRQAFDEWHYNQYLLENPNIDTSSAKYIYDYAHKNVLVWQIRESHFTAWQAAKAIPEGFVVVPKEPTQKMLDATINLAIPAVYVDSISGQHKLKVAAYYKAMINKAQEQANESN